MERKEYNTRQGEKLNKTDFELTEMLELGDKNTVELHMFKKLSRAKKDIKIW